MTNKRGVFLIELILMGTIVYLLMLSDFVVPVLTERCIEETGMTCTELRDSESE